MAEIGPETRPGYSRVVVIVAMIALLLIGGGGYVLRGQVGSGGVTSAAVPAVDGLVAGSARPVAGPAAASGGVVPSFDVVRVSPRGEAVIAGRAAPGAEVVVLDGASEIARVRADRQGAFVAMPAAPLAVGGRSLTLVARAGASAEVRGDGAVVVMVPAAPIAAPVGAAPAAAAPAVLAVLVPSMAVPRVLQGEQPGSSGVGFDSVDYDDKGGIRFAGRASLGSGVRVYVDNQLVGDATTDAGGRWMLTPAEVVSAGVHTLRVDRLDGSGRVVARVEVPFERTAVAAAELAAGRVVVQPGQNLWRLARGAYGSGVRYTVIYLANREQIRDPARIYPGQAFAMPASAR